MTTQVSVVGTIATDPKEISLSSGTAFCTFRLACGERRFNREKNTWEDGSTNWFTVNVFRTLATNALASFTKGDRVFVAGKLRVKAWERNEKSGTSVEIDADALGHELRWGTTLFTKSQPVTPDADGVAEDAAGWANPAQEFSGERADTEEAVAGSVPF